ncbi:MAG: hypothetical protein MJY87_10435, partial [Fibrobacter sp.]|nr:hypothetical protein [Fibrobacter sp.]
FISFFSIKKDRLCGPLEKPSFWQESDLMNYVATVLTRSNQLSKNIKYIFDSQGARLPQPYFANNC